MEISSYHFKHHRITLSAETWPNLFEAFTIKTVRQPFFSKLGEQWFKLAMAPVAESYAYTCIILADFLLWDRRGIVIPLAIIQKQAQPGLRGKGIKNPHIWTTCRGGLFVNSFFSAVIHFHCIQFPLCRMKIIFSPQSDKCSRGSRGREGARARVPRVKSGASYNLCHLGIFQDFLHAERKKEVKGSESS